MKPQTKIYIALALAAIFAIGIVGGSAWSNHRIATLENNVETAKRLAVGSQRLAAEKETEAAEFKQKTEYLDRQLADIQTIARRQDEELKALNNNSGRARSDVDRARRTRSITATTDELCKKLAELGHACR